MNSMESVIENGNWKLTEQWIEPETLREQAAGIRDGRLLVELPRLSHAALYSPTWPHTIICHGVGRSLSLILSMRGCISRDGQKILQQLHAAGLTFFGMKLSCHNVVSGNDRDKRSAIICRRCNP